MVTNFVSIVKKGTSYLLYPVLMTVILLTFWGINPRLLSLRSGISILPFVIIFILSFIGGEIASLVKLPKVVGMILSGFALSNAADGIITFNALYSDTIRNIALAVLLVQAGLELDLGMVKRMSALVLRLCFVPMIAEILITTITGHYILELPFVWSVMLGLILSAACAAIVVPNMIDIKRRGLGVDKGIPSIVTAACSLDDVFAIAGFGITLGFAFPSPSNSTSLTWGILKAPTEVSIGVVVGILYGLLVGNIPSPDSEHVLAAESDQDLAQELENKISRNNLIRLSLLSFGAFAFIFVSNQLDFSGSGPLGALVLAAVTGYSFREYTHIIESINGHLDKLWSFLAIFLFSLIGSDVKITEIDGTIILSILAVLIIGIALRMVTTFLCLCFGGLNVKEKAFISIGWVSKAAVQAAVGPVALTIARSRCNPQAPCDDDGDVILAKIILTTSVLAVLICAPLGALGMAFTAPKFLSTSQLGINTCPSIEPSGNLEKLREVAVTLTNTTHQQQNYQESRRSV